MAPDRFTDRGDPMQYLHVADGVQIRRTTERAHTPVPKTLTVACPGCSAGNPPGPLERDVVGLDRLRHLLP